LSIPNTSLSGGRVFHRTDAAGNSAGMPPSLCHRQVYGKCHSKPKSPDLVQADSSCLINASEHNGVASKSFGLVQKPVAVTLWRVEDRSRANQSAEFFAQYYRPDIRYPRPDSA
jgi:hypothetical protein